RQQCGWRDGKNGGRAVHHDCHGRNRASRKRRHDIPICGVAFGCLGSHRRNYRHALRLCLFPCGAAWADICEVRGEDPRRGLRRLTQSACGYNVTLLTKRSCMRSFFAIVLMFTLVFPSLVFGADQVGANQAALVGYSPRAGQNEREWEAKFRAIPEPANLREYMRRLSARPHHVGSAYDKDNAEWILAHFKEWGLNAHIETFDVLFPTPKVRVLEMLAPTKFTAKLEEPALTVDPTSNQKAE